LRQREEPGLSAGKEGSWDYVDQGKNVPETRGSRPNDGKKMNSNREGKEKTHVENRCQESVLSCSTEEGKRN